MKRYFGIILALLVLVAFVPAQDAHAKKWMYWAYSLTGGTTGSLDNIDACNTDGAGTDLADADSAIVVERTAGVLYFYFFNATSGAAENSPYVIAPDECDGGAYAGDGRWILTSLMAGGSTAQVDFGTTGGRITAASGVFTVAGIGNTNNENITIDFEGTANAVTVSTGTGVLNLIFSALNLSTTGTITGAIPVVTVSSSPNSPTAAQALGSMLFVTTAGVQTINLPDYTAAAAADKAKVGSSICAYMSTANVLTINPADDDKIRLDGTLGAAGVDITSDGAAGDFACFILTDGASDVGHWTHLGYGKTAWNVGT